MAIVIGSLSWRQGVAGLLALLTLVLFGCGDDDTTQIVVRIYAAEDIAPDVERLKIQVEGRSELEEFLDPPLYNVDQTIRMPTTGFPVQHVLAPIGGDYTRRYRVSVTAIASGNVPISQARVESGFVNGGTRVLQVFLPGGPCRGVSCGPDEGCMNGTCVTIVPIDPEDLPGSDVGDDFDSGSSPDIDGGADAGPDCDEGAACEGEFEACEVGRIDCSSGMPVCEAVPADSGTTCREAAGECDLAEECDGTARVCPPDELMPLGTECGDGLFCSDGECKECTAGEACDTGNDCELGHIECETGAPVCVADGPADPGTICRPAAGLCDSEEVCDGESLACPDDALRGGGEVCRAADPDQLCDAVDTCDGESPTCSQTYLAADTECRESAGMCDEAEVCSGAGPECPDDALLEAGTVCRDAPDECDLAETCNGMSPVCPDNVFATATTPCGEGRICNGDGACIDASCGAPCNTGNPCETGVLQCDASGTPTCVHDQFRGTSHECRAAMGNCDVPEFCTGDSPSCPMNAYDTSGRECRVAMGQCDVAEVCTGDSPNCPQDQRASADTECRPSEGLCDVPEYCDGASRQCPDDVLRPPMTVCRAADSTALCDLPELCSGSSPMCPADTAVRPNGYVCRPSNGLCDVAEQCNGMSKNCPGDSLVSQNTQCRGAMGACDVADFCDGANPTCTNNFATSTVVCGASEGPCDIEELCTGTSPGCPTNRFEEDTVLCDAGRSGTCEADSYCTGSGANCPANAPEASGVSCRSRVGECDLEEFCNGDSTACPQDMFQPPGSPCTQGQCDSNGMCMPLAQLCEPDGPCAGGRCDSTGMRCQHLVISEVRQQGVTDGGFLELYNPYEFQILPSECQVVYDTTAGPTQSLSVSIRLEPYSFYLIALDSQHTFEPDEVAAAPDATRQISVSCVDDQSGLMERVDSFAWQFYSAAVEGPAQVSLLGGMSAERKASATSTATSMRNPNVHHCAGNARDTNNNQADFVIHAAAPIGSPEPQSSSSPPEEPGTNCEGMVVP